MLCINFIWVSYIARFCTPILVGRRGALTVLVQMISTCTVLAFDALRRRGEGEGISTLWAEYPGFKIRGNTR
jgi:hypothetical protein